MDAARPPSERGIRPGDHLKNPNRVALYYKSKEARGGKHCIPREAQARGGRKSRRTGITDGMTRAELQAKMRLADQVLMQRMSDEMDANPEVNFVVQKYLPKEKQEELGISINPLYEIQRLYLAGELLPKDQAAMLRDLAKYTHQQAAQKQEITLNAAEAMLDAINNEPEREKVIEADFTVEREETPR